MRIGPSLTPRLNRQSGDEANNQSLGHKDLVRSAKHSLRSVASLKVKLQDQFSDLHEKNEAILQASSNQELVNSWLQKTRLKTDYFDDCELRSLAKDPPLILYLGLEAAIVEKGRNFGLMSSVIVAETICASLAATRRYYEDDKSLQNIAAKLFQFEEDVTMGQVLTWVQENDTALGKTRFI